MAVNSLVRHCAQEPPQLWFESGLPTQLAELRMLTRLKLSQNAIGGHFNALIQTAKERYSTTIPTVNNAMADRNAR